ncbi:MAG: hypothetical protein GXC75_00500 [Xanthomonadaceae bacterium]|nr:hypothetical protein [Xanthomonadaceae bacterium]
MSRVVRQTVQAAALLIGMPLIGLFVYDLVAVRPHVARIGALLAAAEPSEASPPPLIRDLIDAGVDSPEAYAARLAMQYVEGGVERGILRRHARELLWRILLPLHLDDSAMYGLVAARAPNGTDHGLAAFARREYGKSLDALSPIEAARTVAIIKGPSYFLRDRQRLEERANSLLARAGNAH